MGNLSIPSISVQVVDNLAYVMRGDFLAIVDVSNPSAQLNWEVGSPLPGSVNSAVVEGSVEYLATSQTGLVMLDVSNPAAPRLLGSSRDISIFAPSDVKLVGSLAYVAGQEGLFVLDVSNPARRCWLAR